MFFLDPEVASSSFTGTHDPSRPLELLTLVLRGAILGMLKCCDLAWRELAKGGAYDVRPLRLLHGILLSCVDRGLAKRQDRCLSLRKYPNPCHFGHPQQRNQMGLDLSVV